MDVCSGHAARGRPRNRRPGPPSAERLRHLHKAHHLLSRRRSSPSESAPPLLLRSRPAPPPGLPRRAPAPDEKKTLRLRSSNLSRRIRIGRISGSQGVDGVSNTVHPVGIRNTVHPCGAPRFTSCLAGAPPLSGRPLRPVAPSRFPSNTSRPALSALTTSMPRTMVVPLDAARMIWTERRRGLSDRAVDAGRQSCRAPPR